MTLRHIRLADLPVILWKNGAGTARLLNEQPEWRLSVASITGPAPFSVFPGLLRQTGLLKGQEVRIIPAPNSPALRLERPGGILTYNGDLPMTGIPLAGPVEVLNLMRPQEAAGPNLISITSEQPLPNSLLAFVVAQNRWTVASDHQHYQLAPGDILLGDRPFALTILKTESTSRPIAYGIM